MYGQDGGDPCYYVLDARTVVGNCAMWWCPQGQGYTCMRQMGYADVDRHEGSLLQPPRRAAGKADRDAAHQARLISMPLEQLLRGRP